MHKNKKDKVDIVAVARAAKVSASTVSRSFNHPELVNPATRKKIDRAVRRLGYIRNRAAQAMHGKRSGTVGLVVPTIEHAIFAELVQSFSEGMEAAGFTILMSSHGYDLEREYGVVRKLLEHRVDGVALIGLQHSEETYLLLKQQEVPVVAIWNFNESAPVSCVGVRNYEAGAMAARHLLELGHKNIGMVFPSSEGNDRSRDRLAGAEAVLARAGIDVPEVWRRMAPYSIAQAKTVCCELLQEKKRPTALLCGNDVIAQGGLYGAARVGVCVPEELSIVGVGDFKGSGEMEPSLTTVRIPARSIGAKAAAHIVRLISGEQQTLIHEEFPLQIMVRDSSRAVN